MDIQYKPYFMSDVKSGSDKKLFNVVSLFSGGGGSSTGYRLAGGNVLAANEFIESARNTYSANYPNTIVFSEDIRILTGKMILDKIGINYGELDILDGSPPCASFSTAGKINKLWGQVKAYSETKQRTDDLFEEYIRLINEIYPKVFVAENVKGLSIGKSKPYLLEIVSKLSVNYNVKYQVLDASRFGVPQRRQRLFIVGVRKNINKQFNFPIGIDDWIPVKNALFDINQDSSEGQWLIVSMAKYANTKLWYDCPNEGQKHPRRFNLARNWWNKPSRTLMYNDALLNAAGLFHPFVPRRHTIQEAKRLMSYPDDYQLLGTWKQQYERLGRSVPPLLIKAVVDEVYKQILKND